jgi:multidrug efflux pump subunit AcrA (membrane-fusion protein)
MRLIAAMLSAMALVIILFTACHSPRTDTLPPKPRVVVVRPVRGTVQRIITLPGDLVGYYQSALYAKVTGYLKSISVDKGDWVRAGQILAVIEVPELDQRLARAQANLEIARLTYQRLQSVWKSDPRLVARQDVDIAYSKFLEAKANNDELRALVGYTRIIAPFDGVITERFMDPGALINAGGRQSATAPMQGAARPGGAAAPVVSIARLDRLRIYLYVPQGEVPSIRRGMPATVTVQGLAGSHFTGRVERFAHSLDLSTRTMLTEVDLEHKLYPGMYANVALVLERHPDALRLPASALGGEESHQVMAVKNGQLDLVPVSTGITNGRFVEITSGLTDRDLVVQTFSNALQPGEKVSFALAKQTPFFAAAN